MKKICLICALFSCSGLLLNSSFASNKGVQQKAVPQRTQTLLNGIDQLMGQLQQSKNKQLKDIATVLGRISQCLQNNNMEELTQCFSNLQNGIQQILEQADTAELNKTIQSLSEAFADLNGSVQQTVSSNQQKLQSGIQKFADDVAKREEKILSNSGNILKSIKEIQVRLLKIEADLEQQNQQVSKLLSQSEQSPTNFSSNSSFGIPDFQPSKSEYVPNSNESINQSQNQVPLNNVQPDDESWHNFDENDVQERDEVLTVDEVKERLAKGEIVCQRELFNRGDYSVDLSVLVDKKTKKHIEIENKWPDEIPGKTVCIYRANVIRAYSAFSPIPSSESVLLWREDRQKIQQ